MLVIVVPIDLEMNYAIDTAPSFSCLDLYLGIDSDGPLREKAYEFSICELFIYKQQHFSSSCICIIYLPVNPIF